MRDPEAELTGLHAIIEADEVELFEDEGDGDGEDGVGWRNTSNEGSSSEAAGEATELISDERSSEPHNPVSRDPDPGEVRPKLETDDGEPAFICTSCSGWVGSVITCSGPPETEAAVETSTVFEVGGGLLSGGGGA